MEYIDIAKIIKGSYEKKPVLDIKIKADLNNFKLDNILTEKNNDIKYKDDDFESVLELNESNVQDIDIIDPEYSDDENKIVKDTSKENEKIKNREIKIKKIIDKYKS